MTPIQPSIRRDIASGLVAVTVPWLAYDTDDMAWFTLSLDALDPAGAQVRLTNDPSRGVVAFERTGEGSDRFLRHLATALGVDVVEEARMADRATLTIAEDLTTDENLDDLQVVYSLVYGAGHEVQMTIDLDEESVVPVLLSSDGADFIAHLTA